MEGAKLNMSLDLATRIRIQYKVTLPESVNAEDAVLVIRDSKGKELARMDVDAGEIETNTGRYIHFFDGLDSRQMRDVIYATVYANGEAVTATYSYSIATYAYIASTSAAASQNLVTLTERMVIFGDSALAHFG